MRRRKHETNKEKRDRDKDIMRQRQQETNKEKRDKESERQR